jgi:Predicted permease
LSGLLQGVLGGAFFVAMGFISPVLWGVVMGVLAFLPILGVGLVLLPTALILLIKGQIWQTVVTCGFYLFLTVFIEYLFKPKFVGSQARAAASSLCCSPSSAVSACSASWVSSTGRWR